MKMPRRSRNLYKKRTWSKVKSLINDKRGHSLDFEEKQNGVFRVFVQKGRTQFFVNLFPPGFGHVVGISETNDTDYQEFVDTYQTPIEDSPPEELEHEINPLTGETSPKWTQPLAGDGKVRVLASHKPVIQGKESWNYFCSVGDLVASGTVGGGQEMLVCATSGTFYSEVTLEFLNNTTPSEALYLFGGGIMWEGAGVGDRFCLEIVCDPSPVVPKAVADTIPLPCDFNLDGDKIVATVPGSGTHALGGMPVFVQNFKHEGYWDLDKINMVPVPNFTQTGDFDWHTTEQVGGHFINDLLVAGTSCQPTIIDGTEAAPLPYGYKLKLRTQNHSDTDWKLWGFLRMYRERLK
jgi:hypothetical protein